MLAAGVLTRIRSYVDAEIRPRDRILRETVQAAIRRIAASQGALSGASAHASLEAGRSELQVRAGIIWRVIARSYTSLVGGDSPSVLEDLRQQIAEYLTVEARTVADISAESWRGNDKMFLLIRDSINVETRNELRAKCDLEAQFFVDQLRRPASPGSDAPAILNFHAPVGSVQTGPHATAHVVLDASDGRRLLDALESLRGAIEASAEMTGQQRAASLELISDLVVATKTEKPNTAKIGGLLKGLAQTVQTVASVQRAWDVVKSAAIAAHVWLSHVL